MEVKREMKLAKVRLKDKEENLLLEDNARQALEGMESMMSLQQKNSNV